MGGGGVPDIDVCSALWQQAGPFLLLQNCLLLTSDDNAIAPLALLPLLGDDKTKKLNRKQYGLAPRTFEGGAVSPLPILHFRNRAISQNDKISGEKMERVENHC